MSSPSPAPVAPPHPTPAAPGRTGIRIASFAVIGLAVAALVLWFGIPMAITAWNTVSTDDAYVNAHVTAVAARIPGQVATVLVDDNNRVRKGDSRPPRQRAIQGAGRPQVRGRRQRRRRISTSRGLRSWLLAQARSSRFKLEHAIENVGLQVAQLHSTIAGLELATSLSAIGLRRTSRPPGARQDAGDLVAGGRPQAAGAPRRRGEGQAGARERLPDPGRPRTADERGPRARQMKSVPRNLGETPANLDQTFSTVRQGGRNDQRDRAARRPVELVRPGAEADPRRVPDTRSRSEK